MDWDLLKTFEAVARLGSLTAAAQSLGLSQSTVSRQMNRLEEASSSPLLVRSAPVALTARGETLLRAIQPMVTAALMAAAALEDAEVLQGEVTLATVAELLRWSLAPRLDEFHRAYPGLTLKILTDNRTRSLAAGEADLSLRLARPERGDLVAKKVHTEHYGWYATEAVGQAEDPPWLGLTGTLAHIPEQRFAARRFAPRPARLLVEDIEALAAGAADGLGLALLPRRLAARYPALVEQVGHEAQPEAELPTREVWLVVHRSKQHLPKVRAVMEWLLAPGAGWRP